jgi:lipid A ethanolaminephosphotransferase
MNRRAVSPLWVVVLSSLWMAATGNAALLHRLDELGLLRTGPGAVLAACLLLMTAALLCTLLATFAWRHTLKPAVTLLLLATALASHFMRSYHVVIDPGMMLNVLQTDWHETRPLLDARLLAELALLALLPAWLLWRRPVDHGGAGRQLARNAALAVLPLVVVAACAAISFRTLAPVMRSHTELRYLVNPLSSVYALARVAARPLQRGAKPLAVVGRDARLHAARTPTPERPPLLVLVVGETARSGNFSLNGYGRPTNPELAREQLASFGQVRSCGTSTAASLPCMFSPLGREGFIASDGHSEGLLDVLQRAGLAVLWLDNQSGCKGVCDRVPKAATCPQGDCLDEVMLQGLDERLGALDPKRRAMGTVIVLHQMGSHGPTYHLRSPPSRKPFLPECTAALQDCTHDEVLNAYDNSIAYTDHFLAMTIGWLRRHEHEARTALVYLADHGESLGENHLYLHGLPYSVAPEVQKHVPWVTWLSPQWQAATGLAISCLQQHKDAPRSHDHYFHSVLGLMGVDTGTYRQDLDVFAPCTPAAGPTNNPA